MTDPTGSTVSSNLSPEAALFGSGLPAAAPLSPDLLDLAPDAVIIRTLPEDRIVFWSGGAERLYGWSRQEALGQSCGRLLQTRSASNLPLDRLFSSGIHWRGELTQTCRDGSTRNVESCQTLRRSDSGPEEVLEVDREALGQARQGGTPSWEEARFRALTNTARIGVWAFDAEGRTRYANGHMGVILGRATEEIRKGMLLDFCFEEDHAYLSDHLAAALHDGERQQFEARLRRAGGEEAWALVSLCLTAGEGGAVTEMLGLFVDVTARKRAITSLEEKNARLARAIVESHHRIKNNLQTLAGLVELQVMSHPDVVPAAEVQRLGQYTRSLASLHDILTLDLQARGATEPISLQRAAGELLAALRPLAPDRRIMARIEEAPLTLKQGSALALLLNELITNAVKHGDGAISVISTIDEGEVHLEVLDHGPGFPAGFDPVSASGTGLSLVETAVRWDLRGRISYGNRPSGGGRVTLQFPVEL